MQYFKSPNVLIGCAVSNEVFQWKIIFCHWSLKKKKKRNIILDAWSFATLEKWFVNWSKKIFKQDYLAQKGAQLTNVKTSSQEWGMVEAALWLRLASLPQGREHFPPITSSEILQMCLSWSPPIMMNADWTSY